VSFLRAARARTISRRDTRCRRFGLGLELLVVRLCSSGLRLHVPDGNIRGLACTLAPRLPPRAVRPSGRGWGARRSRRNHT